MMSRAVDGVEGSAVYVAARRVLLDALAALAPHRDALVLVGAQAVYLRTAGADLAVSPYTSDSDLAVNPSLLGDDPRLENAMRTAGFVLSETSSGHREPGQWVRAERVGDAAVAIAVDLMVPAALIPKAGRRAARIPPHANGAARKIPGLEPVVADNDVLPVVSLESDVDSRAAQVRVAGPASLLVAKEHKIADRLADGSRRDRLTDKDAADVVRLIVASRPSSVAATLARLAELPEIGEVVQVGLRHLRRQFGTSAAPGVDMAIRSLAGGVLEPDRIRALCPAFTRALPDA